MKKILALLALLLATPAHANVPCSVPFNLQNATIADATQVMANYNAIITCLGNAAAAGANNDITSLSALSTPITPAQGGTTNYIGTNSTGTNAQVVTSTTPTPFSLTAGRRVVFIAGSGNNGPTTLNVGSAGAINFYRRTQLGISAMVGGEIVAGQPVEGIYDGSEFVCMNCGPYMVGEIRSYGGATAPVGWAFIDGSCQTRTTYPDLFAVIGTAYDPGSVCDTAHFALPDGRGRVLAGLDNMGVNGAANRITSAGSGCVGTTIGGAGCGAQNQTLTQAQIPTGLFTLNDPGHFHSFTNRTLSNQAMQSGGFSTTDIPTATVNTDTKTTGITLTDHSGGQPHPLLNPLQIVTKIIKL
jgi:microcystin-dependent protein